jgi:hypothetical protein
MSLLGLGGITLAPDVLEEQRGAWCSPLEITEAVGHFHLDPFTNPRSTLIAGHTCMLERGDDGFGLERRDVPGTFYVNPENCEDRRHHDADGLGGGGGDPFWQCNACGYQTATEFWKVWIQPDYGFVIEALPHYGHTRFTALLRLDTSTVWFMLMYAGITEADLRNPETRAKITKACKRTHEIKPCAPLCEVIMVPKNDRLEFVPPPGVKASSNPYPHGLYYKRAADVTEAVRALCYPWPTSVYPWREDPLGLLAAATIREVAACK